MEENKEYTVEELRQLLKELYEEVDELQLSAKTGIMIRMKKISYYTRLLKEKEETQ